MTVQKYCAAPWRGLHINFRGDVKTCCAGDPNMLGNINRQSIQEILNGSKLQEIRQSIQQGALHPEYCHNCIQAEKYGSSERDWHNRTNPECDINTNDYQPTLIDIRWNTTCNLSCNYCGPYCSSRWASILKQEYRSGARPYYTDICDFLEQHRDNIREVALVGGEPLLLPENERLLDVIPQNCTLTLITNINVNFETNRIVKKILERSKVGWSISFDNVGDRFEYVRYGADWQLTKHNVQQVVERFKQGHWGGIHAVYNVYNCTRLCELRSYADSMGIDVHWQTLHHPEYLDPAVLGPELAKLAINEIQNLRQNFKLRQHEQDFFAAVEQRLLQSQMNNNMVNKFNEHINLIENVYHAEHTKTFEQLWPELREVL